MTGLMPSYWGNPAWVFIHSIAFAYKPTEENKARYYDYFYNLQYVLPCDECKAHYKHNITGLKDALGSQESLFRWTYDLHNLVNKQTGVPEYKWPSYESVKKRYSSYEANCNDMPGVCGTVKNSHSQKGTMVVERFGSVSEDSLQYMVPMIILGLLLLISIYYNLKCGGYLKFKK